MRSSTNKKPIDALAFCFNLHQAPQNIMMRLFYATEELNALRQYVLDAFQRHLAIDATGMTTCRFVLAAEKPGDRERSLSEAPGKGDVWDFMRRIAEWLDKNAFDVQGPEVIA